MKPSTTVGFGRSPANRSVNIFSMVGFAIITVLYFLIILPPAVRKGESLIEIGGVVFLAASVVMIVGGTIELSGMRYRDTLRATADGLDFVSPTGKARTFRWDQSNWSLSIEDWREREYPPELRGLFAQVVGTTRSAWIDVATLDQVAEQAKVAGWKVSSPGLPETRRESWRTSSRIDIVPGVR